MNTGTSKGLLLGALLFGLAACEDFAGLNLGGATGENLALNNAKLAGGTISLVPPSGFCVDKRSLRQNFALMARCDTLGGRLTTNAPLAIITATTVTATGVTQVSTSDFESASETVLERIDDAPLALVQVKGKPPSPGMRDTYWRGAARIGDQVIGLALYQKASNTDLGSVAPNLLIQTVEQTQEQSIVAAVALQDNSATQTPKPAGRGFVSGLFE
ncbi:hypothetical protein GCM10007385_04810 [Tateyamaria omphalii]|uniref:hypothetical protein n=1 Tax=Tateyamaria omphalii TaxID=299262 RepID=UPI0016741669|nr:hypothetical protein [Tateyamaria omphalii]GGX40464.1 hypothetical protein GCM10007385_04810 [Tateyamaria omphalii]